MPADTLEQFAPFIEDERFTKLDPVGKAEFREKAFAATIGLDEERRKVFDALPETSRRGLKTEFMQRFNARYGDHFKTDGFLWVNRDGLMNPDPVSVPIMDPETERVLAQAAPNLEERAGKTVATPSAAQKEIAAKLQNEAPDVKQHVAAALRMRYGTLVPDVELPPEIVVKSKGGGGRLGNPDDPTDLYNYPRAIPNLVRFAGAMVPPAVAAYLTGPVGVAAASGLAAGGAAVAEPIAQALEKNVFHTREDFSATEGLINTAVAAVPGARFAKYAPAVGKVAVRAAEGAAIGAGQETARGVLLPEHELTARGVGESALLGAGFGTVFGAVEAGILRWARGEQTARQQQLKVLEEHAKANGYTGNSTDELKKWYQDWHSTRMKRADAPTADTGVPANAGDQPAPAITEGEVTQPPAPKVAKPADETAAATDNAPEFTTKLPDDPKAVVKGRWRIVESDAIRTSRDAGYDATLQPRDRTRAASTQQVSNIARTLDPEQLGDSITSDLGAPLVNANGDVLSGNGRTEAIREAYGSEMGAAHYKEWVANNAEQFGMTAESVAGMKRPILVRQATDLGGIAEPEFARRSNPEEKTLRMSDAENAASDAAALLRSEELFGKFRPSEEGDVLAASNREFLNEFIDTLGNRGEFIAKDGQGYNAAKLAPRVRNAVLAALVGPENRGLIDSLVEDSEGMKRITAGLLNAAPRLLRLRKGDYHVGEQLTKALHDLSSLRKSGEKLDDFLSQTSLFGDGGRTAESDFMLRTLAGARSAKAVTEFFGRYEELASKIDTTTPDLFGSENASRLDLLKRAAAGGGSEGGSQTHFATGEPPAAHGESQPATGGNDAGSGPAEGNSSPGRAQGGVAGNVEPSPSAGVGGDLGEPGKPVDPADNRDATIFPIELPEMVWIARELGNGKFPKILEKLRALKGAALGVFRYKEGHDGVGGIELRADIFNLVSPQEKRVLKEQAVEYARAMKGVDPKIDEAAVARAHYEQALADATEAAKKKNPKLASKVVAHEIGHWIDWLGDKIISGRGNLFGRIASLKGYTKSLLAEKPGAPGLLTDADRARLHRQAGKLAETEREKAGMTEGADPGVTPEEILDLWQSTTARDKDPGLYDYVAKLTPPQKKELVRAAMKGKVSDWFVFQRDTLPKLTKSEREFYAELLKAEITKRRLFDLEEMKAQIRPLVAWWRGTATMEAYFEPSEEMYAEVFSVLLNNPAAVKKRAPLFYEAFFNYLERKPEYKALYSQIQDAIKSGEVAKQRVLGLREAWTKADEAGLTSDQLAATPLPLQERLDAWRMQLDRTFGPIYRRMKANPGTAADDADKAISDYLYRATLHEGFLRAVNLEVLGPLTDANLDWIDLAEYMFHQHVFHNRADIASSRGWNPKASRERLDEMARTMGPSAFAALEKAQQTFRRIYERAVLAPLRAAEVFDDKLLTILEERTFYATMSAVRTLDDVPANSIEAAIRGRYGDRVAAQIYKQVGYLGDVKNPATATAQKALSLISLTRLELAKRRTVELLLDAGEDLVVPAEMRFTGVRREPVEVFNDRIGTLTFLHKGKVQAYYVPRAVYEAFRRGGNPVENIITAGLAKVLNPIKALYTELNYGFWPVAFYRDVKSFARKMPEASLFFGDKALLRYLVRARAAAKASVQSKPSALADDILRRQMVISKANLRGEQVGEEQIERMMLAHGMTPTTWRDANLSAAKGIMKVWQWYSSQGQINERTVKIAGVLYLDEHFPTMPEVIKQRLVHEQAGSPNFLQRAANPYLNLVSLFYNPWREGLRSEKRAWQRAPGEMLWKFAKYAAGATVVAWMLEEGYFNGLIPDAVSKRYQALYRSISEYDKTNYQCIPLGWADEAQKKVLYIRLPLEEGERLLAGILRKSLTLGKGGQGILSYAGGQVPGINPVLSATANWFQYSVAGQNPYDSFRGRSIIADDKFKAGQGTIDLVKHTANQLGAGLLMRFGNDSLYDAPKDGLEKFLASPGVSNLVGRWVKVSNRGYFEALENEVSKPTEKARAELRLVGQEMIRKLGASEPWTDSEKRLLLERPYLTEYVVEKLPQVMARQTSPEAKILIGAKSKEERAKLLEAMMKN